MISTKIRLPPVAGLLIAGMLIGPNVLSLVNPLSIESFSQIGAVLLLFMIGVEFSMTKLLAAGMRVIFSSMLLVFLTFVIMHEVALLLGLDTLTALFSASIFSMSSTAIMMKILDQKGLIGKAEVPVLVAILIIEDIIAVFVITFFSTLKTGSITPENVIGAVIISLGILVFAYVVLLKVLRKFSQLFLRYQADDTLILFSFALGIGMSIAASMLGLTPAIGAFLAGSIIAGLPNGRDFENAIRPFGHVFSSFFFISIGMLIDPNALVATAHISLILIASFIVTVFLAASFSFFLISTKGKSSIFAGLALIPLGEFSLLIAAESTGMVETNLIGIASVGVLITSLICSFSLNRSEELYFWLKSVLPERVVKTLRHASGYFLHVIGAFEPHGHFHNLLISEVKKLYLDILYILSGAVLFWVLRPYLGFPITFAGISQSAENLLFVILGLILLVPITKLLLSLKKIFDVLSAIFSRTTPIPSKGAITKNLMICLFFLFLFANFYLILDFLRLPSAFNWISIIFFIFSVFFFWSAVRASSLWLTLHKYEPPNILRQRILISKSDLKILGKGHGANIKKNTEKNPRKIEGTNKDKSDFQPDK